MKDTSHTLKAGLYIVATPIGNLGDITLRALETLKSVDVILCEDTRESQKLLHHYGIVKKLMPYHEHNGEKMRPLVHKMVEDGMAIALISDAGTPLISDPGYKLVRSLQENGHFITTLPGASSVLAALTLAGLPTDHFLFCGFVNRKSLITYTPIPYTLAFLSSPHKVMGDLRDMATLFAGREVAVVREISKIFEEVKRGTFTEILDFYATQSPRGEIVLCIGPKVEGDVLDENALLKDIETLKNTMPTKKLAEILAGKYGLSRKDVYDRITSSARN